MRTSTDRTIQRRKRLEIGEPGYGGMVARAMIFSAAVSAQFELGPVSEASIGNVGMRNATKMAWVDLVITPVLGTAWMVGEDVIDERILKRMDGANTVLRNTAPVLPQSLTKRRESLEAQVALVSGTRPLANTVSARAPGPPQTLAVSRVYPYHQP